MMPVLFKIYGWPIHSYGLMLALAFLVGVLGVGRAARRMQISFDTIVDLGVWILVGAVVGARLAYVGTEFRYYIHAPLQILFISSGGLAFQGGLIGGFLGGFWFVKVRRLYPWKIADLVAPFIALGYSIVRIGCLLNGCCYGKPASLPWAFACAYNDPTLRHPTQIYSMVGSLILFFILWRLQNHRQFPGFLFLLYIGLYSIMRFIVEIYREGPMVLPWLSLAQLVCIVLGIFAFGLIGGIKWRLKRRAAKDAVSEVPG